MRYRSLQRSIAMLILKVRKLYHARCKYNNKHDPKIINLNKMAIPKKAYLLSFFSRHYHKIMKLKCKARRYLSLFCCNCVSHMTNYVNFKLSIKILGPGKFHVVVLVLHCIPEEMTQWTIAQLLATGLFLLRQGRKFPS